ncbi:GNAT family N-acetyltransferase [Alteribacillus sp. HJP-4]|uniref:GNAT family N-acetyltransferase n=1 Tax=Alteribacillus sp. HJP-4 TaxID=2775394 RepID=UPI0035CCDDDE
MTIIRAMKKKDIASVRNVATASWHDTYDGLIPRPVQDRFLNQAYSDRMMKLRLKRSNMIVAERNGIIIGFVNISHPNLAGESELAAIYLLPEYQRKGSGSMLLEKAINAVPSAKTITLNVESDNAKGKHFYEARGFKAVGEEEEPFDGHTLKTTRMICHRV